MIFCKIVKLPKYLALPTSMGTLPQLWDKPKSFQSALMRKFLEIMRLSFTWTLGQLGGTSRPSVGIASIQKNQKTSPPTILGKTKQKILALQITWGVERHPFHPLPILKNAEARELTDYSSETLRVALFEAMVSPTAASVLGAFVFMVLCNILATKKFFGGKYNKELSDENPTYLSPDGKTFAVWGFIYLLETVLAITQLFPSEATDELFDQECPLTGLTVRQRLIMAFLANGVWLPVFNNERFWTAMVIILMYLGLLLSIYSDVNTETTHGIYQYVCFASGIAMNCSWVVIASCVSSFLCLGRVGWRDENGVAGSANAAVLVVLLVTGIACERAITKCDLPWAGVAAWALMGIYRMQTVPDRIRFPLGAMNAKLGGVAQVCSYMILVAMLCGGLYFSLST